MQRVSLVETSSLTNKKLYNWPWKLSSNFIAVDGSLSRVDKPSVVTTVTLAIVGRDAGACEYSAPAFDSPSDSKPPFPMYTSTPSTLTVPCFTDRKSTRLNSSHVRISYAVFCLKKK